MSPVEPDFVVKLEVYIQPKRIKAALVSAGLTATDYDPFRDYLKERLEELEEEGLDSAKTAIVSLIEDIAEEFAEREEEEEEEPSSC